MLTDIYASPVYQKSPPRQNCNANFLNYPITLCLNTNFIFTSSCKMVPHVDIEQPPPSYEVATANDTFDPSLRNVESTDSPQSHLTTSISAMDHPTLVGSTVAISLSFILLILTIFFLIANRQLWRFANPLGSFIRGFWTCYASILTTIGIQCWFRHQLRSHRQRVLEDPQRYVQVAAYQFIMPHLPLIAALLGSGGLAIAHLCLRGAS